MFLFLNLVISANPDSGIDGIVVHFQDKIIGYCEDLDLRVFGIDNDGFDQRICGLVGRFYRIIIDRIFEILNDLVEFERSYEMVLNFNDSKIENVWDYIYILEYLFEYFKNNGVPRVDNDTLKDEFREKYNEYLSYYNRSDKYFDFESFCSGLSHYYRHCRFGDDTLSVDEYFSIARKYTERLLQHLDPGDVDFLVGYVEEAEDDVFVDENKQYYIRSIKRVRDEMYKIDVGITTSYPNLRLCITVGIEHTNGQPLIVVHNLITFFEED